MKILFLYIALFILAIVLPIAIVSNVKKKMRSMADNTKEITPKEFFAIRNATLGGRGQSHISNRYDFPGVYILFNKTKNMYYVGQGKSVFQRVNSHFTGHGNGDVYADYKNGNEFSIKMISLENSGCSSLNELERKYIMTYNSYYRGYNKTRGNA